MSDTLTAEERAAIAAFPEERVAHIPRGASGLDHPNYVYDPASTAGGRLRATNPGWSDCAREKARVAAVKQRRARKRRGGLGMSDGLVNGVGGVESACVGKVAYATRGEAQRFFERIKRRAKSRDIQVYQCRFCHQYHIGTERRHARIRRKFNLVYRAH